MAKWDFRMSQSRDGTSCTWRWRKTDWDLTITRSRRSFPSYEECVADAAGCGYDASSPTVITKEPTQPDNPALSREARER